MNELIPAGTSSKEQHLHLLGTVSALSLLLALSTTAHAEDIDRPTVWIELGGQLSRLQDGQELYSPPFLGLEPSQFNSPAKATEAPGHSWDASGAISIQPLNSAWVFSAAVRYGRATNNNHLHQQSYPKAFTKYDYVPFGTYHYKAEPFAAKFIDAKSRNVESHAVLDFEVGKDVGVGLFGRGGSSVLNVGVRFAQFQSKSSTSLQEDPDWRMRIYTINVASGAYRAQISRQPYHTYAGRFDADRSFHGIGPSLSWNASTPLAGDNEDRVLSLDWGLNASLLFGKQKTETQHHTSAQYHPLKSLGGFNRFRNDSPGRYTLYQHPSDAPAYYSTRLRNVVVPNLGGFAGISFKYDNAKVNFGYKADFFFGAMDGGIDVRKTYDRNFYGPFATISIGLGG